MKIIITEHQREKLILKIPDMKFLGGWDGLQILLKRKGYPDYEYMDDLDLLL